MLTFVLFDIDGTLVSLDGAGSRSLNRAMAELLQVTDGFRNIDFAGKTDLQIIREALENAGSGVEDVVRTRVLLTNIDDWKKVIEVRAEYFKNIRPVDTIMQVSRFVNPEWLVEFEADAVLSDGTQPETVGP